MTRLGMPVRLVRRSFHLRRTRAVVALVALTVCAAVATAMLNLYMDLESKLHREFRSYGANIVVLAPQGGTLSAAQLRAASQAAGPDAAILPVGYAIAQLPGGAPVVVAGIDFGEARRVDTWWSVTRWPQAPGEALAGSRALAALNGAAQAVLTFDGRTLTLPIAGTLHTGGDEDSRLYTDLPTFARWTGLGPTALEILAPGGRRQVEDAWHRLQRALPNAEVRPVRQLVESEAGVIDRTRSLMWGSLVLIAVAVGLCVLATLTASVLERRRDYALMKALGSSQALLNALFAGETATLAVTGSLLGYALGSGLAAWIGRADFHAAVLPRPLLLPWIVLGTLCLALLAALLPLAQLQRVQPANLLKGE